MKVLIVNTSERVGGAAVAACRLAVALNAYGAKATMLVSDKETDRPWVVGLPKPRRNVAEFVWERFVIWIENKFSRKDLFSVSIANAGVDITRMPEFHDADIIHLHWINQGMLSLKGIRKIVESGKPIVWTMHDMWNMTGICHYAGDCDHFVASGCKDCPIIPGLPGLFPSSERVFKKKERLYASSQISFVACSKWLEKKARGSKLLSAMSLTNIPNPIDTKIFAPAEASSIRQKHHLPTDRKLLLFGSMKVIDKRKGISYLIEACEILFRKYESERQQIAVVVLGGQADGIASQIPFPVYPVGFMNNQKDIAEIYNAVDLYVSPSLEDNLPNTIMEALACGTPCVGFEVGGIPEMIVHRVNGYIARYKSAEDLADGIYWSLFDADTPSLRENARRKVLSDYSESVVSEKYINLYRSRLNKQ
jgi:glycosyltransferase involved in cell wall biosynthesis